ncbi:hypothetical protein E0765_05490 [Sulfuricurvum sp. IAE1]|uniref:hypothetical protein n=1 Tax=Sulfuricurvum sp. IAE1 TaxID=2546102 RepID=UPI001043DCE3|nr:hypothetical protein [Sulfuricurvum sp. IAE1]MDD3770604.1 hypothetical protein [Sulfuricurvum sp.]MDX9967077.1 hypothetical protein [Sulfuricurvum sp.]TDA64164.1 hypothetical protein E0765_05490 [Sulfuricurvum sp. IAE1]
MRGLRKWFALLFILSLFATVAHELDHDHHHDETCEVCLLAHAPALLDDPVVAAVVESVYDIFSDPATSYFHTSSLNCRNRSPPLF